MHSMLKEIGRSNIHNFSDDFLVILKHEQMLIINDLLTDSVKETNI